MQYPRYVKKITLLLALVGAVQLGFAFAPSHIIQPLEASLLREQVECHEPRKSGLRDGQLESSITHKFLKYLPLAKAIYEEKGQQQKILMPGIVVDDVIVMLHDTPQSLYTKTDPLSLERSPG